MDDKEKEARRKRVEEIRQRMASGGGSAIRPTKGIRGDMNGRSYSIDNGTPPPIRSTTTTPRENRRTSRPKSAYSSQGQSIEKQTPSTATTSAPPTTSTESKDEGKDITSIVDALLDKAETVLEAVDSVGEKKTVEKENPSNGKVPSPRLTGPKVQSNGHNNKTSSEKKEEVVTEKASGDAARSDVGSDSNPPSDDAISKPPTSDTQSQSTDEGDTSSDDSFNSEKDKEKDSDTDSGEDKGDASQQASGWERRKATHKSPAMNRAPSGFLSLRGAQTLYASSPALLGERSTVGRNTATVTKPTVDKIFPTPTPNKPEEEEKEKEYFPEEEEEEVEGRPGIRAFKRKLIRYSNPLHLSKDSSPTRPHSPSSATDVLPSYLRNLAGDSGGTTPRDRVKFTLSGELASEAYKVKFRFKQFRVCLELESTWTSLQIKTALWDRMVADNGKLEGLKAIEDYILHVPGANYYLNDSLPLHRVDMLQMCKKLFVSPPLEMVEKPPELEIQKAGLVNVKSKMHAELNANFIILDLTQNPVSNTNPLEKILESKNNETESFRKEMTRVRRRVEIERAESVKQVHAKYNLSYLPQYRDSEPMPLHLEQKITFECVLPIEDQKTSKMSCSIQATATEVRNAVFHKYQNIEPAVSSASAEDYILKVTGYKEYLFGDTSIISYDYVRRCISKKQDIFLSLIPLSEVDLMIPPPVEDSLVDMIICRDKPKTVTKDKIKEEKARKTIGDLSQRLRIKITGIENIDTYNNKYNEWVTKQKGTKEADPKKQEKKEKKKEKKKGKTKLYVIYVQCTIVHGDRVIGESMYTGAKLYSNSPMWNEWLVMPAVNMCDIPRGAKICFRIYRRQHSNADMPERGLQSVNEKTDVALAWVNCQFIDHKDQLRQGTASFHLWPGEGSFIGTCVENVTQQFAKTPMLYVEFQSFGHPVFFPPYLPPQLGTEREKMQAKARALTVSSSVRERLEAMIKIDPLRQLTAEDKKLLWENREYATRYPLLLPRFLQSVKWEERERVEDAYRLLSIWEPVCPFDALQLLDAKYASPVVRRYAVDRLENLGDRECADFLLQLTQVLKYEQYHNSPLAQFLLTRALRNNTIGHALFWHLKSELNNQTIASRYSLILESYLRGCGNFREEFVKQNKVLVQLTKVALAVKEAKAEDRKNVLQNELEKVVLPEKFRLPLDQRQEVSGLIHKKCKFMDSKKLPLWLVFNNVEKKGKPVYVIFKAGDDLRQDVLTLQMIRIMDKLWKNEGLDLRLNAYGCVATGDGLGMIEVVMDAATTAAINKKAGGSKAVLEKWTLVRWLAEHNRSEVEYEKARETFMLSCAGYCVATYVLGIGDRHNDNIMLTKFGHLFHIDFGHFLGNYKSKYGYKRERAPFIFNSQFAAILTKSQENKTDLYDQFVEICGRAYNILRKHANMFINLFMMMLSTGIPELQCEEDIQYMRDSFALDMTEKQAAERFANLIKVAKKTKTVIINDIIHIWFHND